MTVRAVMVSRLVDIYRSFKGACKPHVQGGSLFVSSFYLQHKLLHSHLWPLTLAIFVVIYFHSVKQLHIHNTTAIFVAYHLISMQNSHRSVYGSRSSLSLCELWWEMFPLRFYLDYSEAVDIHSSIFSY